MADKPIIDGPVAFFGNSKRWPVTMRWPQTQDVFAVTVRVVGAQGQVRVEWLRADIGIPFREWLGIKPKDRYARP